MRLLVVPFLLLALASPARAERSDFSTAEVRVLLSRYADCIAERHPVEARAWVVDLDLRTHRQRRAISDPACLSSSVGSMTVSAVMIMYVLADSLVRAELKGGPIADLGRLVPIRRSEVDIAAFTPKPGASKKKVAELEAGRNLAESLVYLSRFGDCVVRANPAQVYLLLQAQPTSEEETAAFQGLSDAMNSCLVDGRPIKVNKGQLRGVIALFYYRLAHALRATAGASN